MLHRDGTDESRPAEFGRYGDGKRAGEALGRAIQQNPLAAAFLLDLDVPEGAASEREEEDAERCAQELAHVWADPRSDSLAVP